MTAPQWKKWQKAFHRPIDILVNNAGIYGPDNQNTKQLDCDAFADLLQTNVIAPMRVVQAFLPLLQASAFPRLVNISSRLGTSWHGSSGKIAYRASKAALNKLTQCMAEDLSEDGITCVAMHPGWVRTDMGGQTADISPKESAFGIFNVLAQLKKEDHGTFINYNGERWEW